MIGDSGRAASPGFLIAVVYKYVDDQGSYLAALITYMLAVTVTKRPTVTYRSGWMATAPPKVAGAVKNDTSLRQTLDDMT